jgi:hypothetical protein
MMYGEEDGRAVQEEEEKKKKNETGSSPLYFIVDHELS